MPIFIQTENFGKQEILQFNYQLKRFNLPNHIHQFAELVYSVDGEILVTINDSVIPLRERDFLFIMPMRLHGFSTPVANNTFVMTFSYEFFPELFSVKGYLKGSGKVDDSDRMFRYAFMEGGLGAMTYDEAATYEYPDPNPLKINRVALKDKKIFSRFKSAVYSLLAVSEEVIESQAGEAGSLSSLFLWLESHYTEPITLANAAKSLGYSTNYLSHRIKKLSGMSFPDILSNLRVEYSRDLLLRGMTVLDAALESGFETERSFYRAFRKVTGMTPGEYVKGKK